MPKIMTVKGPVSPEDLGFTSMHEHILVNTNFLIDIYKEILPEPNPNLFPPPGDGPVKMEDLAFLRNGNFVFVKDNWDLTDEGLMGSEVGDFKIAGGDAILEVSGLGIRHNPKGLRRISEKTGVHIIASTGFYSSASWPAPWADASVDEMVTHIKMEIDTGLAGTDVKPGHIKVGPLEFNEAEERSVRAVARACRDTGLSATAHQGMMMSEEDRRKMIDIFVEEGADPSRVLICHMQSYCFGAHDFMTCLKNPETRRLTLEHPKYALDKGFNISFDCFGTRWHAESLDFFLDNDFERMAGLIALINEGYSKQLVIGTDVFLKIMTRRYGGDGYARLLNFVVPTLKKVGVSENDIQDITVGNPARILAH
jgi:phosphotriesterase-related protein